MNWLISDIVVFDGVYLRFVVFVFIVVVVFVFLFVIWSLMLFFVFLVGVGFLVFWFGLWIWVGMWVDLKNVWKVDVVSEVMCLCVVDMVVGC